MSGSHEGKSVVSIGAIRMQPEESEGIFEGALDIGDAFFGAWRRLFLEPPHEVVDEGFSFGFILFEYFCGICIEI